VRSIAALALLAGCTGAPGGLGGVGPARGGGSLRQEDRAVVSTFNEVTGVAVSRRYVFSLSTGGLAIYDRTFNAWRPPLALGDEQPRGRPSAVAADPTSDGVWIGGVGTVTYYQALTDFATRSTVPGIVDVIAFDRRDPSGGALVRASGQWSRVTTTGFVSAIDPSQLPASRDIEVAPTLREVADEFPALESFGGLLTRDAQLRSWPISAAAKSPDRTSELWVGTMGNGLFRVDPSFNRAEQLPFGLLDPGAGALALAADGVWIASLGESTAARGGLTFASVDLQRWRWLEGSQQLSLAGTRAFRLDVRENRAWLATDRGLVRFDTRASAGAPSAGDVVAWSATNGLPSDVVLSVAARPDGAWAGTSNGLVFVSDSASRRSARLGSVGPVLASGAAVRALLATGDTLWVGTDVGLLLVPPGEGAAALRPSALATEPRLGQAVTALATSDSEIVVATRGALLRFQRRTGRLLPSIDVGAFAAAGGIRAVAMDGATIWVAGPSGVVVFMRSTGATRFLGVPADIPGEAFDVALGRDYAWVATRDGVVRLRRLRDGSVR
jgi:ligand-binding sensor domain-containing protein